MTFEKIYSGEQPIKKIYLGSSLIKTVECPDASEISLQSLDDITPSSDFVDSSEVAEQDVAN